MPTLIEPTIPAPKQGGYSRKTSPRVRMTDKLTTAVITGGGILVIVAVLGIMVFLAAVVLPLFRSAEISEPTSYRLFAANAPPDLLFIELDEHKTRGLMLERNGRLTVFDARTGKTIEEQQVLPSALAVSAFARTLRGGHIAFGFADGSVRLGQIKFAADGIETRLEDPLVVGKRGVPVALLDYKVSERREGFTALKADGELVWEEVIRRENILTGKVTLRVAKHELPFTPAETPPAFLLQNAQGDQVYLAWRDGTVRRYDLRQIDRPVVAETVDFVGDPSAELTSLQFMFGDQSLIAADSRGGVHAWFRVERADAPTADGYQMVVAHTLDPHASAVTAAAMSVRDKGLLTGTADGEIFLRHMTSQRVLGKLKLSSAVVALQLTPKADGIFALAADGTARLWEVHNPHPETTWQTIFGRVWYEGYNKPTYTWQSSSGNDDFEPKFSLVPLIFGTLKATFYSLLFAVPIALLGAIYTSQFLDKRLRTPIKSGIETMASLPSVVLGFIAALVLAPIVENWTMAVLTAFALVPLAVLLAGYLWQMLPQYLISRYSGWPSFALMGLVALAAMLAGRALGGAVEHLLFAGDFKGWLDGRHGTGAPALAVLMWPLALLVIWLAQRKFLAERFQERINRMSRARGGLVEMARLLALLSAATAAAWGAATVLSGAGVDPRGALLGTYVQRNTLVVGFVMGFAVIPIIYTISEDAISSVPEHLTSASLGCGATPWQTTVRVILPVAASGIFSAVMIGLGRAVGETMVVVMAAGNTPILDVNIFNGLRALSANIAVELPEAVKDSTLYRMLFLAALTLFVMTFCLNTAAEWVRMRFRRRAFQL